MALDNPDCQLETLMSSTDNNMTAADNPDYQLENLNSSIDDIIWSDQTHTVKEIITSNIPLPIIAKVVDSYLDDQDTESHPTGEILWMNKGVEQRRLIMESRTKKYWSVPISQNIKIKKSGQENEEFKSLLEVLVEEEIGVWNEIRPYLDAGNTIDVGALRHEIFGYEVRIIREHSMLFLTGLCLSDTSYHGSVVNHHHKQTFSLGIGLTSQTSTWPQFTSALASLFNDCYTQKESLLPGITLYSNADRLDLSREINKSTSVEYDTKEQKEEKETPCKEETLAQKTDKTAKRKSFKLFQRFSSKTATLEKGIGKWKRSIKDVQKEPHSDKLKYERSQVGTKKSSDVEITECIDSDYLEPTEFLKDQYHHVQRIADEQTKNDASTYKHPELMNSALEDSSRKESYSMKQNVYSSEFPVTRCERDLPPIPTSSGEPEDVYEDIETNISRKFEKVQVRKTGQICSRDDLPDELDMLTLEQVGNCLVLLHLNKHVDNFKENGIDGNILCDLTKDILVSDLGLTNFEALKLKKFIDKKWLPNL